MKIGKKLNTLTYNEYMHLFKAYKSFTDFNHLGLFRSITETCKLSLKHKIEIRDASINTFPKFFEFLQVKDPWTYAKLIILGQDVTVDSERRIGDIIRINQRKILANKRIKHRNFGIHSKHACGYDTCNLNDFMIKQGSVLAESNMRFQSDRHCKYGTSYKSHLNKQERKKQRQIIREDLANEAT